MIICVYDNIICTITNKRRYAISKLAINHFFINEILLIFFYLIVSHVALFATKPDINTFEFNLIR